MNTKRVLALVLALMMTLTLFGCGEKPAEDGTDDAPKTVTITDMIGRQVEIVPGSYQRVVCIGAGALRLYSYVGDVSLLCGVEDIDNTTLEERPKMFDGVARPYVMVYGDTFAALPSCGVGGPNAQAAEAEKILSCTPDIIVSEYEDTDKAEALQQQVGVPVITLRTGVDGVFSEDFSGSITLLGQVFGKETRASELLAFVSTETADIQARTAGIAEDSKPAVYICGLGNWGHHQPPDDHRELQHVYRGEHQEHRQRAERQGRTAHRSREVYGTGTGHGHHAHRRGGGEKHQAPVRGGQRPV